jgi:hypothetical protein
LASKSTGPNASRAVSTMALCIRIRLDDLEAARRRRLYYIRSLKPSDTLRVLETTRGGGYGRGARS